MDEKQPRYRKWILLIILLLIIHLILLLVKVPVKADKEVMKEVPYNSTEIYYLQEKQTVIECSNISYQWDYSWLEWQPEKDNMISPTLEIQNKDKNPGEFIVYFAFFNNAVYDYENYKGKNYEEVRSRLPWNSASMYSRKEIVYLNPGEKRQVVIYTEKAQTTGIYWSYAVTESPLLGAPIINLHEYGTESNP